MIDFSKLDDNIIIICPKSNKRTLVKELMKDEKYYKKHVKFMDKKEVLEGAYFSYDLRSLYYVHETYKYNYELAKEILDNLYDIELYSKSVNKTKKLDDLYNIYIDLKTNNYLIYNNLFKNLFNGNKIIVYGYSKNDKALDNAFKKLGVEYTFYIDDEIRDITDEKLVYVQDIEDYKAEIIKLENEQILNNKKLEKYELHNDQIRIGEIKEEIDKIPSKIKALEEKIGVESKLLEIRKTNNEVVDKVKVYSFKKMEDELLYVINEICALVNLKGSNPVSLNNIYLYNIPDEYTLFLKKYFEFHNIPFEYKNEVSLYESPVYKKFIELLNDLDFKDAYEELNKLYKVDDSTETTTVDKKDFRVKDKFGALDAIVNAVIDVNDVNIKDKDKKVELLNYVAKTRNLKAIHYEESVKVCNSSSIIGKDDYVFMLGFSIGSYPVVAKDTDLFTDNEKTLLCRNTSLETNEINKEQLIHFINKCNNIIITCKEKFKKDVYYPSLLTKEKGIKLYKQKVDTKRYSDKLTKQEISEYYNLDDLYGIKNDLTNLYTKDELNYGKFNHEFKEFAEYVIPENIKFSYTSIDEYYHCPFKFFVNRVLKVNMFEDTFDTNFGTLCHELLEEYVNGKYIIDDFDKYIEENKKDYITENFQTEQELYFVYKLLPQIKDVIKLNDEYLNNTEFTDLQVEQKFEKIYYHKILEGTIDKVLMDKDGKNIIVVDYKTSQFKFDKRKPQFGINLQLPLYGVLLKDKYSDFDISGLFIQNICVDNQDLNKGRNYLLKGIGIKDLYIARRMDTEMGTIVDEDGKVIKKSRFINTLALSDPPKKPKKKAEDSAISEDLDYVLSGNYKAFTKEEMDNLIETANQKAEECIKNVLDGNFKINPLDMDYESSPCDYCKYKSLCFAKDEDKRTVELPKDDDYEEKDELDEEWGD